MGNFKSLLTSLFQREGLAPLIEKEGLGEIYLLS
jgi:hypothetical protein